MTERYTINPYRLRIARLREEEPTSQWIFRAENDYRLALEDPEFVYDEKAWLEAGAEGVCRGGLAGAVMRYSAGVVPGGHIAPSELSHLSLHAIMMIRALDELERSRFDRFGKFAAASYSAYEAPDAIDIEHCCIRILGRHWTFVPDEDAMKDLYGLAMALEDAGL